jgi:DNA adenine methylase
MTEARPLLRWAGGKTQSLPSLKAVVPESFGHYFESFLGGAALFFSLRSERELKARLSDTNAELIDTYKAIQSHPEELILGLEALKVTHSAEQFYEQRSIDPETLNRVGRAARMIYLNGNCRSGLYRVNASGKFNVPIQDDRWPKWKVEADRIRGVSAALQGVQLACCSYERLRPRHGDFVYFDPPYDGTFTAYQAGGFGVEDQKALATRAKALAKRGVHVVVSNSKTDLIIDLYKDGPFTITEIPSRRSINSNKAGRGQIPELLIHTTPLRTAPTRV